MGSSANGTAEVLLNPAKVAHMAEMYQLPLVTGGGWHRQNAHLIAAVNNGWMTEHHAIAALMCDKIFVDPVSGERDLPLSDKPGLGLELNVDGRVREAEEQAGARLGTHQLIITKPGTPEVRLRRSLHPISRASAR